MGYRFVGEESGDFSGLSTAIAGDVDGDGLEDILIGAPGFDGGIGRAYLIFASDLETLDAAGGSVDGVIDLADVSTSGGSYVFEGYLFSPPAIDEPGPPPEYGASVGSAVSSAGDFNGDGLDDIAVSALFGSSRSVIFSGETYLISAGDLAALDGQDGATDRFIDLREALNFGESHIVIGGFLDRASVVAGGGDVDGDGLGDILLSSEFAGEFGETYLLAGQDLAAASSADGTNDNVIQTAFIGQQENSYQFDGFADPGLVVPQGGFQADTDGDGFDEISVVVGTFDNDDPGSVLTFTFGSSGLDAADAADGVADGVIDLEGFVGEQNPFALQGETLYVNVGASGRQGVDLTGDGVPDYLIGIPQEDGAATDSGAVFLISGTAVEEIDALDGTLDGVLALENIAGVGGSLRFDGDLPNGGFGVIGIPGDVDGDGLADLIVGSVPDPNAPEPGQTYLITSSQIAAADARDGASDGVIAMSNVICFAEGSLIETGQGAIAVEDLMPGDLVQTRDNGRCPVLWVGSTTVPADPVVGPVRISRGVLGAERDLIVSPHHRILLTGPRAFALTGENEVLASAISLVNDHSIRQSTGGIIRYFHILLDRHEILLGHGVWSESFQPCAGALARSPMGLELQRLFPEFGADFRNFGPNARPGMRFLEAQLF